MSVCTHCGEVIICEESESPMHSDEAIAGMSKADISSFAEASIEYGGHWPSMARGMYDKLTESRAQVERLQADYDEAVAFIRDWAQAYDERIIPPPTPEEIEAVNRTREFVIGRNALAAHVGKVARDFLAKQEKGNDRCG